jgi:hypothetical protein
MHVIRYLRDVLAPSRHCSILIETPLVGNADWENDLSIVPKGLTTTSGSTFIFSKLLKTYTYVILLSCIGI